MKKSSVAIVVVLLAATGCVPSGKYDEAVASSERAAAELRSVKLRSANKNDELATLSRSIAAASSRSARACPGAHG